MLEGLKGKPVAELSHEHQNSQAQYDQWRDQFLAHAAKALEVHEQSQRDARLTRENAQLKTLVTRSVCTKSLSNPMGNEIYRDDYTIDASAPFDLPPRCLHA